MTAHASLRPRAFRRKPRGNRGPPNLRLRATRMRKKLSRAQRAARIKRRAEEAGVPVHVLLQREAEEMPARVAAREAAERYAPYTRRSRR